MRSAAVVVVLVIALAAMLAVLVLSIIGGRGEFAVAISGIATAAVVAFFKAIALSDKDGS